MLLFSIKKVVVKVCFDFGRSVNSLTPSVNVFSKVKENCIIVFTRLNTAKEPIHAAFNKRCFQSEEGVYSSIASRKIKEEKKVK